jgi:hypothetical protein
MNSVKIILGLVPFALFSLLAGSIPIGWAALAGMLAAIIVLLADLRGGVKAVPIVAVITMAAFAVLGLLGGHAIGLVLGTYGRGLATLVLAAFILITAGFAPFTATYAKETTPKQYWGSETFVRTNRRISIAWGGAVLVMAVGHLLAEGIAAAGITMPIIDAALNWGLPISAIIATVKYTKRTVGTDNAPQPRNA